jgi:hypothetical protein
MTGMLTDQNEKKKALLTPLDDAAYASVEVPTREDIRLALERGSKQLRHSAEQSKPVRVDPRIRFR